MNSNVFSRIFLIIIFFCLTYNVKAEPTVWKVQSKKTRTEATYGLFKETVVDRVKEMTKGQLIIDLQPVSEIKDYKTAFSSVRIGALDGMFMSPQYWGNVDALFTVIGDVVAAWDSPEQFQTWLHQENGIQYLQNTYHKYNMHLVGYAIQPHESLVSLSPLRNMEDIKGQLMRTPPGMVSDFFLKVGARCRRIDNHKVLSSFKGHKITIADFSILSGNYAFGLYEVAKHTNYPGFHSIPLSDFVVNNDKWQAISPEYRKIVSEAAMEWNKRSLAFLKAEDEKVLALIDKVGVNVYQWSDEEKKKARSVAVTIWDEYATKSPEVKEMIKAIKVWLRTRGSLD